MSKARAPGDRTKQQGPRGEANAGMLVVGIGSSAGGLEALGQFFKNMPADSGMAFVVITHTPAGHNSLMPELLSHQTSMPAVPVTGPMSLRPNHIYLAAGGEQLLLEQGKVHAVRGSQAAPRHFIDTFFRSLAAEAGERAVGIVLSGTGTDGTAGIKEIKAQGGMTMAQEEASARFAAMPHSAIASLQVDYVLSAEQMPAQLVRYAGGSFGRAERTPDETSNAVDQFARIFALLRSRTGHDFSHYKGTTIRRRIERRMNVHQLDSLKAYVQFLHENVAEVDRLFKELLIGVTSFFRDPEAHQLLTSLVLPELVQGKPEGYTLRLWVAGCSTGEEAYTLAIEVQEALERAKVQLAVQIFATDLDPDAIEVARLGEYPDSIAADVSPERLERYFTLEEEGFYRISKQIREMVLFAPHSLIEDPPFTKLDLLSCRNLLIYLEGRRQQQLMPVFHYSLRPGGVLFLGSSESVGGFGHLFEAIDKKWKIFRRRDVASNAYPHDRPLAGPETPARDVGGVAFASRATEHGLAHAAERALLQQLLPPTIIMHERGEIVHIHGRTGMFLEPAPGAQGSSNVYNMAREGLQLDLAVAIRHAAGADGAILHRGVRVKANGHYVSVDLRVKKLTQPEALRGLFLVAFEGAEAVAEDQPRPPMEGVPASELTEHMTKLERELTHAKEVHQSTIEELETANEELKSTNEELQSTNEELQSANEELETSKEEMQSLNEELQTVNAELQGKVEELSRANDDMKNLLNGTDIATVFLDNELNIKRYTEQARKVIRLIPSDVGRPVADLVSKLKYRTLAEDAQGVLSSLVFKEAEVQGEDGVWYLMRMLPYRTTQNVIDGLVVTFVDITKIKGLQEEIHRFVAALGGSPTSIFQQNAELIYDWAFGSIMGRPAEQLVGKRDEDVFGEDGRLLREMKQQVFQNGKPLRRRLTLAVDGVRQEHDVYIQPVPTAGGAKLGVSGLMIAMDSGDAKA